MKVFQLFVLSTKCTGIGGRGRRRGGARAAPRLSLADTALWRPSGRTQLRLTGQELKRVGFLDSRKVLTVRRATRDYSAGLWTTVAGGER
jgi:hypothetical protein